MARIKDAKCKICRREGAKLYLKGAKCLSPKCTVEKRPGGPGMHPSRGRMSNYGKQFREKQKVKRLYGLLEKQFRKFFTLASKDQMQTGSKLLQLLERRLDNVVHRMGTTESRTQARQLVNHGHILVNGKKLDIPSYLVKVGDKIELKKDHLTQEFIKEMQTFAKGLKPASWIEVETYGKAMVSKLPDRSDIDPSISEQLIVEYYSR